MKRLQLRFYLGYKIENQINFCRLISKASLLSADHAFQVRSQISVCGLIFFDTALLILSKTSDRAPSKYLLRYSRRPIHLRHMARSFSVYTVKIMSGLRKTIGHDTKILRVPYLKLLSCKPAINFIINLCFNKGVGLKYLFVAVLYVYKCVNYGPYLQSQFQKQEVVCIINYYRGKS